MHGSPSTVYDPAVPSIVPPGPPGPPGHTPTTAAGSFPVTTASSVHDQDALGAHTHATNTTPATVPLSVPAAPSLQEYGSSVFPDNPAAGSLPATTATWGRPTSTRWTGTAKLYAHALGNFASDSESTFAKLEEPLLRVAINLKLSPPGNHRHEVERMVDVIKNTARETTVPCPHPSRLRCRPWCRPRCRPACRPACRPRCHPRRRSSCPPRCRPGCRPRHGPRAFQGADQRAHRGADHVFDHGADHAFHHGPDQELTKVPTTAPTTFPTTGPTTVPTTVPTYADHGAFQDAD
jgi:hypothetical protein